MFYDFIYLAKGFRMRPKVRSTLSNPVGKKDALIIYGGKELARLEKSLPDPTEERLNEYEKLRKKLNNYFMPKRNKHHARYIYLKSSPVAGKTTVTYATRLRGKAQDCEFGTATQCNERILEHLIQTIENESLIQRCISKVSDGSGPNRGHFLANAGPETWRAREENSKSG